jgi:hypothetical protein
MKVWNIHLISEMLEQEIRDWNFGKWVYVMWSIKQLLEKMSNSSPMEHTKIISLLTKLGDINGNKVQRYKPTKCKLLKNM